MSIFPYIGEMVKSFHIVPVREAAIYAGFITSAFTLAEFSTGFLWGRLSDRIGRKPVLLCGMAGTALSVLMFGLAPNYYVALVARALGGLLNGYVLLRTRYYTFIILTTPQTETSVCCKPLSPSSSQ